jgi:hypothetical protein
VAVCVAAAAGALVATGLAYVLIITTPRPLTPTSLLGIDIVISNEPPAYRDGGARPRRQQESARG